MVEQTHFLDQLNSASFTSFISSIFPFLSSLSPIGSCIVLFKYHVLAISRLLYMQMSVEPTIPFALLSPPCSLLTHFCSPFTRPKPSHSKLPNWLVSHFILGCVLCLCLKRPWLSCGMKLVLEKRLIIYTQQRLKLRLEGSNASVNNLIAVQTQTPALYNIPHI